MLLVTGFAYGLRWIDHRFAPSPASSGPHPVRELRSTVSEQLAAGLRFAFGIPTAQAAEFDAARFRARPIEKIVTVEMAPGETRRVSFSFENQGTAVWKPEGRSFISLYTIQPRYHPGVFRHSSWLSSSQPARLASPSVAKGAIGEVAFTIQAPPKEGAYSEMYQLAAEDTAWMWGGFVTLKVNVRKGASAAVAPAAPAPALSTPAPSGNAGAILLLKSAQKITAGADQTVSFTAGFKNSGASAWTERGLKVKEGAELRHPSWPAADTAVMAADAPVLPGQIGFLNFVMTTPKQRGDYVMKLALTANGSEVGEALLEIPVTVTSDAPAAVPGAQGASPSLPSANGVEPMLRVGLYTTEKFEEISYDGPFEARDNAGGLLASFSAGARVQFQYDAAAAQYRATNGILNLSSSLPIRFVPLNPGDIFTLWSHEDRPSWNASVNYNRFRGALEMRKNDRNAYVWLINELPMEQYLKGMKETSQASPLEFQKALATAARSYANWHYANPGKHWHFTVDAEFDQVYKGYVAEQQNPKLTQAADATRGQVVTYNGQAVITPYFSWSDGRTRDWTEVWGGGSKPWLVSVPAPHDAGKTLFGHGVGLSAWDAIGMANDGALYDAILAHYYQGTGLLKLY